MRKLLIKTNKCNFKGCQESEYKNLRRCVIHCNKDDWDVHLNSVDIQEFSEEFGQIVLTELESTIKNIFNDDKNWKICFNWLKKNVTSLIDKDFLSKKDLCKNAQNIANAFQSAISSETILFSNVEFPKTADRQLLESWKGLINRINSAWFHECKFRDCPNHWQGSQVYFDSCSMYSSWTLNNLTPSSPEGVIYDECTFYEDISTASNTFFYNPKEAGEISGGIFRGCTIKKKLEIKNTVVEGQLFLDSRESRNSNIGTLIIENCQINSPLKLNNIRNSTVLLDNSEFNSKVEFKDSELNLLDVNNSNFHETFDINSTKTPILFFKRCKFHKFAAFENIIIGKDNKKGLSKADFEYVTFHSLSSFRDAIFYGGLDLSRANFEVPANFLGIELSEKRTNQETYRVIKVSFDTSGNKIEADTFFRLEMKKFKQQLKHRPKKFKFLPRFLRSDYIIFKTNELSNDFGRKPLRPVFLIILLGAIFKYISTHYERNTLYRYNIIESDSVLSESIVYINELAKAIIPFDNMLREGMEAISLLFGLATSTLAYLCVSAVKRRIRR